MEITHEKTAAPVQCVPFPANPSPGASGTRNSSVMHEKRRRAKILVVDDYQPMREMVSDVLSMSGHDVMSAENGLHALDLFRKKTFDVVVTDLTMPGMDGWELARHIKAMSFFTPVLAMTATSGCEAADIMDGEVLDSVVFKPFLLTDLLSAVQRMIEAAR